jgi:hypothetical protein
MKDNLTVLNLRMSQEDLDEFLSNLIRIIGSMSNLDWTKGVDYFV